MIQLNYAGRVSVVSIIALPCSVFLWILFIFITSISMYSSQWLQWRRIHKLPLILKNRLTKMCFLSIYFGAGGHFLGAVDSNKLKCERTVLKGEEGSVCACITAVPCCFFLQYSRQRVMEISQLERRCITLTSLHCCTQKRHIYQQSERSLCSVFEHCRTVPILYIYFHFWYSSDILAVNISRYQYQTNISTVRMINTFIT